MRSIELIELGLNEIARECRIIDEVLQDCKAAQAVREAKGKGTDETFTKIMKDHEKVLADIHHKVRDLLEYVGEYLNCGEMVTGVDVAINKTIYDLVYERTTEKDYE